MSNPSSDSYRNPLRYQGQDYSFAPRYYRPRDPLAPQNASTDIKPKENQGYYPLASFWSNSENGNLWVLAGIVNNLANWVLIGSANGSLLTLSDNSNTIVEPSSSSETPPNNIQLTSNNGSVSIIANPGNHSIDFSIFSSFNYIQIATANSPYTVQAPDYYIACNSTAGAITIKLPNAPVNFRQFVIKDKSGKASTNNILVTTVGGSVTIDTQTTYTISSNFTSINLLFNGSTYEVF